MGTAKLIYPEPTEGLVPADIFCYLEIREAKTYILEVLTKTDLKEINKLIKAENKPLMREMKKGFAKLDKKLDKAINFLDRDYIKLLKRIERIEKHLDLEPISL